MFILSQFILFFLLYSKLIIIIQEKKYMCPHIRHINSCTNITYDVIFLTPACTRKPIKLIAYLSLLKGTVRRLCINHPFTAKCKFWVWPIITARSAHDRYSVNAIGVIYGVLATLCRHTKCRLRIVSPIAMPLLPFTDKECGNINGPRKRLQCIARNTGFSAS